MAEYSKSFPNDVSMDKKTFLNDKKMPSELYIYMVIESIVRERDGKPLTFCEKKKVMPTKIAALFEVDRHTISTRLKSLEDLGMIEYDEAEKGYWLPRPEKYLLIPITTAKHLEKYFTKPVMRVYIYLGTRFKWKAHTNPNTKYLFTKQELIDHCGFKIYADRHQYNEVNEILEILQLCKLINYDEDNPVYIVNSGNHPYPMYKLLDWQEKLPLKTKEERRAEAKKRREEQKKDKNYQQMIMESFLQDEAERAKDWGHAPREFIF